jgi:hypothetical protein
MFRTVRLSTIRSLFTVHSAMVYVIQVCRQLSSGSICFCSKAVWHIPLLSVQWINSWWWTDELSETCRVSWQNKFVKLMHLVGFITKKPTTLLQGYIMVHSPPPHMPHNIGEHKISQSVNSHSCERARERPRPIITYPFTYDFLCLMAKLVFFCLRVYCFI